MADYQVRNDRLYSAGQPVRFEQATSFSPSRIVPEMIILHDTAGRLDKHNSVDWFTSQECKTSAHLVVERDGSVTQLVDFDRKAFHAGESCWEGRQFCNGFAIGIEIVNPGELKRSGDKARAWFHREDEGFPLDDVVERETKEHGHFWWMPYTDAQVEAVTGICKALAQSYPTIGQIVTHWLVSPGRKVDTNPLFPLDDVREAALVRRPKLVKTGIALGAKGEEVRKAQERLTALGYALGSADGQFGSRTRAAVLAFEAENKLKTDGALDADELEVLHSDKAKAMPTAAREDATIADLKNKGSEQVKVGGAIKTTGQSVLGLATGDAVAQQTLGFSPIGTLIGYLDQAIVLAGKVGQLGLKIPPQVALYMLAGVGGLTLWHWGSTIQWKRLADHIKGLHLGR